MPSFRPCVLHLTPDGAKHQSAFAEGLGSHLTGRPSFHELNVTVDGQALDWTFEISPEAAEARLHREYIHVLIVDLRGTAAGGSLRPPSPTGPMPDWIAESESRIDAGFAFLSRLDQIEDIEARYGFHRIVALVGGVPTERMDGLLVELGRRGIANVLRDSGGAYPQQVAAAVAKLIASRRVGRHALCAAGGGITGIYFEIGALKCLDDCLRDGINHFDMYFGISAGAIVTALLAVGFSVDEFMAAVAQVPGGRIEPVTLNLLRMQNIDVRDLGRRLGTLAKISLRAVRSLAPGKTRSSMDALFLNYPAVLGAPFHSDRFGKLMRGILTRPGATDDFRALPRPLYVGASEQDERRHVLFGAEGYDHIPISLAVQASMSVNPAFGAVEVEGRFYEDGAVTRTSNFVEAIHRGADLLFVLDPFVPYVSKEPGLARRRGVLYNIDQDIRTISFTRFENARKWVLRKYPSVSSYTFLPSNRLRRLLSVNPMDHRPYLSIWRGAYLSTLRRVHALAHRLRGDLEAHGLKLDTRRADLVAERLRETVTPTFEDFFPERRVYIRQPKLCMEP